MNESKSVELGSEDKRGQIFGIVVVGILLILVTNIATIKFMGWRSRVVIAEIVDHRDEMINTQNKRTDLEIRSFKEQITHRDTHLRILENELVFGGTESILEGYTDKEKGIRERYLAKKETVLRARTLPILTAQIDELRPHYPGSQWDKGKVPDLPPSKKLAEWFYTAGKEVEVNPMILISVAWVESRFRPDVCHGLKHSEAGAVGCMQIMPFHVKRFEFITDVKELATDIETNIMAGSHILREYLDHRYAEKARNQLEAALRLYNYGPTNYGHRLKKKRAFNNYAEEVIKRAEKLYDGSEFLREKFGPENDPAAYLITPLALTELPVEQGEEIY